MKTYTAFYGTAEPKGSTPLTTVPTNEYNSGLFPPIYNYHNPYLKDLS